MQNSRHSKLIHARRLAHIGIGLTTVALIAQLGVNETTFAMLPEAILIATFPVSLFAYIRIATIIGASDAALFWGSAGQLIPGLNSVILIIASIKASDALDEASPGRPAA